MIYDIFTFNGEYDLLEIRLNILNDFVDEFIIVEVPMTFSGKPKELYYEKEKERYKKWHNKIRYYIVDENDPALWEMAKNSPNTLGAEHWKREFVHKESIKKALTHLKDGDLCFVGDVDEIPDTRVNFPVNCKLKLDTYIYALNNRSNEQFWGTIFTTYKNIKNNCLNHLRTNMEKTTYNCGWHFSSLKDILRRKLEDSYTSDSYASPEVMAHLEENIQNNKDFLGRNFTYRTDESELPQYLIDNKYKYASLFN